MLTGFPDVAWLIDGERTVALGIGLVLAVVSLGLLFLGLSAALTGRSHYPKLISRLRLRTPRSERDERLLGRSQALMAVGGLMMTPLVASVAFGWLEHSKGTPRFIISLVGLAAYLACLSGSLIFFRRVRFVEDGLSKRPATH